MRCASPGLAYVALRMVAVDLKLQLQRELNLARGAEVAGRETRAVDQPKGGRSENQIGISEVRMVENVEYFGAELRVEPLRDLGVFDQGEVRVHEGWAYNRVPAEITEVEDASGRR